MVEKFRLKHEERKPQLKAKEERKAERLAARLAKRNQSLNSSQISQPTQTSQTSQGSSFGNTMQVYKNSKVDQNNQLNLVVHSLSNRQLGQTQNARLRPGTPSVRAFLL